MKLTPAQSAVAMSRLNPILREHVCSVCDTRGGWSVQDTLFELREFSDGALDLSGKLIPLMVVTCNVCSNTLTFNAIQIGALTLNDPNAPPAKAADLGKGPSK